LVTDEIKLTRDTEQANRARILLDDPMLQEAFKTLEQAYIDRWRVTDIHDDKGREKLFVAVNVVGKVKDHLALIVSNGSVAKSALDDLAKEAERKKRFRII